MPKNIIKITLMSYLFIVSTLHAEIDLQKGIYDAAEEMIAFDEKMNQAIAEHNQYEEEMQIEINDFEEREDDYLLEQRIPDQNNTKISINIKDTLLTITTTQIEKEDLINELNMSSITTISSSSTALFIPNNADATKMEKSYSHGVLRITFPKK